MTPDEQTVAFTDVAFDALLVAARLSIPEDMRAQVRTGANQLRLMAARLHAYELPAEPAAPE